MTEKKTGSDPTTDFLRQAKNMVRVKAAHVPGKLEALSSPQARRTIHERQVYQIELLMQNEELRRTQAELEASQALYFDLYDLAPVGYLTISEKGLILEANLTAARLKPSTTSPILSEAAASSPTSAQWLGIFWSMNRRK